MDCVISKIECVFGNVTQQIGKLKKNKVFAGSGAGLQYGGVA